MWQAGGKGGRGREGWKVGKKRSEGGGEGKWEWE